MSFITQENARKFRASESLILSQLARIVCFSHIPALYRKASFLCAFLSHKIFMNKKIGSFFYKYFFLSTITKNLKNKNIV